VRISARQPRTSRVYGRLIKDDEIRVSGDSPRARPRAGVSPALIWCGYSIARRGVKPTSSSSSSTRARRSACVALPRQTESASAIASPSVDAGPCCRTDPGRPSGCVSAIADCPRGAASDVPCLEKHCAFAGIEKAAGFSGRPSSLPHPLSRPTSAKPSSPSAVVKGYFVDGGQLPPALHPVKR